MARSSKKRPQATPQPGEGPLIEESLDGGNASTPSFWNARRVFLGLVLLTVIQLTLCVTSLVEENPTIDEVVHLPAGITYWQTGRFGLYHHNPPLFKLVAALPVLAMGGVEVPYEHPSWTNDPQNKAVFAHEFQKLNAREYLEIFSRARLVMPLFAVLGGLAIFWWSRALYGTGAGFLSLALWVFCPNILAHARLITSDVPSASLAVCSTFLFWRYLRKPTWFRAILAGLFLGVAELTKFSLILFYGFWPILALLYWMFGSREHLRAIRPSQIIAHAFTLVFLSVLVIDMGYGFEGVGTPLGRLEFISQSLTRPVVPGDLRPSSPDPLLDRVYQHRVNRFRGTWLGQLPIPVPMHYLLGFDDQKFEAEGVPARYFNPDAPEHQVMGYPVYLDGELRDKSWWYYYLLTLVYKVPEGTWLLFGASMLVLFASARKRESGIDEVAVLAFPAILIFVMSVFTNINLGLRYVLPSFPFLFVSMGKLVPWASEVRGLVPRRLAFGLLGSGLLATVAATGSIAPHYLSYFNWVSGGPSRGSKHLIDSNLDWGQDLVGLQRWLRKHAPGESVGLAYFGQINPNVFLFRPAEGFSWFLPPPRLDSMSPEELPPRYRGKLEGYAFQPGLYAVSASLLQGLKWRVYENELPRWFPRSAEWHAFSYFKDLEPIDQVGNSILIYRISPEQARELSQLWAR